MKKLFMGLSKEMQNKTFRYLVAASGAFIAVIVIDVLDFVARWLSHLEPYKNNIERFLYFSFIVCMLIRYRKSFQNVIRTLRVNAGSFGFEIEFKNDECVEKRKDDISQTRDSNSNIAKNIYPRSIEISRKILSRLSAEMRMVFSENTVLKRGDCRYMPDGFGVKNGHAYIIEIKLCDRPHAIDMAIQQLSTFAGVLPDKKLTDVTAILCIVSNQSISYFEKRIGVVAPNLDINLMIRVFEPKDFEQ